VKRRHYSLRQESEFSLKNNHKVGIIASIFTKLCIVSHFAGIPAVPPNIYVINFVSLLTLELSRNCSSVHSWVLVRGMWWKLNIIYAWLETPIKTFYGTSLHLALLIWGMKMIFDDFKTLVETWPG